MNRTKKSFCSAALALLMTVALLFGLAVPAFAAGVPSFYLTPIECKPGEEVIVFMRIYNAVGAQSGNAEFKYDKDMLELVSFAEAEEATEAGVLVEGGENMSGGHSLGFFHMDEVSESNPEFTMAKFVFRAKEAGKSKLTVEFTDLRISSVEGSVHSKINKLSANVTIGNNVDSKLLADEGGSDFDWGSVSSPADSPENSNYGRLMLIAGIIVVAAVGIVVVVSVLTRKKTDENPNKIDVKKE